MAVHLAVAKDVFVVSSGLSFSFEMSWMRSGTELSRFLGIFPTYTSDVDIIRAAAATFGAPFLYKKKLAYIYILYKKKLAYILFKSSVYFKNKIRDLKNSNHKQIV